MAEKPGKLPLSATLKAVLLLAGADVAVVAAIVSQAVGWPNGIFAGLAVTVAVVLFAAFVAFVIYHPVSAGRKRGLYSLGRVGWLASATLFWAVSAGLGLFALGFGVAMVVPAAGPILVYGLAFAGVVLMTWSAAQRAIRKRRVLLVLSALERSIGMNLPLAPMIRAAAESEKGKLRRRLFALHACLDRGEALDQALLDSVPEISLSTARAIGAGVRMGCPERMMGMLIRRQRRGEADRARIGFYWVYPLVIVAVVGLLMIAVIPKFQGIFPDFRVELPWTTRLLIELSRNGSVIAVAVVVLSLVPLGRALGRAAPGLRGMEPFGGAVGDQLLWWTPVVGGMMRDRSMGELCEMVSAGVDSGLGLNESLHEAAAAQSNAVMRDRASAWADGVARGESIHEAARYARMPRLVVAMLATVRNEGTMSQVLGFLRRHYDYRFSRARAIADAACVPAITFFFGAVVALVGASLMQPIAVLNENIARHILGGF